MKCYLFFLCAIIISNALNASSSEKMSVTSVDVQTVSNEEESGKIKKTLSKEKMSEPNSDNLLTHINKYIAPLQSDFKNYIVPVCAKIGTTSSTIISILNLVSNSDNGIAIPSWVPVLTNSFTFVANVAWLVQHISDKNQVQLFLNKTNDVVQQAK